MEVYVRLSVSMNGITGRYVAIVDSLESVKILDEEVDHPTPGLIERA